MKTTRLLVLLLVSVFSTITPRAARSEVEVSFDFFYDSLAPHGDWIEVANYGPCWRPVDVDRDWTPYTDGYWAFTDAGWTWVSYEDFGGIVYHYGRWVRLEGEGWCWVPDYEWAPAWVSWRESDDYVGWAPLPPEARWRPSIGISIWSDREYDIGPAYYSFCRVRDFGAPVLRPVIVNRVENVTIIRRTVNITNITYNTTYVGGPVIYNGGPRYAAINGRSSRPIPALRLVRDADFRFEKNRDDQRREPERNYNARAVGNQLVVSAPTVRPPSDRDWMKGRTKKVIAADQVTRGWSGVRSEDARRELRQELVRQSKGLTPDTAPARPLAKAELQAIPAKADARAASPVAATSERRDRTDRKERNPEPVNPLVTPPAPPTAEGRPTEKSPRERERAPDAKGPDRPVATAPALQPFKPADESKLPAAPDADPRKMREPRERVVREPADPAAAQAEAQRRAESMRQQQQEQATAQQMKQAESERSARRAAEAAAGKQKAESDQRAAQEAGRARAAEQARSQEMETRRRQGMEQQAAEQQRRQAMEQQRAAQEAARQQMERAVGEQRRERERPEMPTEPRRQERAPEAPRIERPMPPPSREAGPSRRETPQPPAPATPGAPQEPEKERRGRDKDKDR